MDSETERKADRSIFVYPRVEFVEACPRISPIILIGTLADSILVASV
jgi:hypothetical protein